MKDGAVAWRIAGALFWLAIALGAATVVAAWRCL